MTRTSWRTRATIDYRAGQRLIPAAIVFQTLNEGIRSLPGNCSTGRGSWPGATSGSGGNIGDGDCGHVILCNRVCDLLGYLKEWHRVLKTGKRAVFTDPVVITGPVSNEELAGRSNIGFFLFVPLEITQNLIKEAGFKLLRCEDVTGNIELTSGRWHAAREKHQNDLIKIEGEERFAGLQTFFSTVHRLTSERRLSRFVFLVEK